MILIDVEIYNYKQERYKVFEAILDTGASICAIAKHITKGLGINVKEDKVHLWQVRDPLALGKANLRLRYKGKIYNVEAVVLSIPKKFQRDIAKGEECTRPRRPNPLSNRIILGENFISKLPEDKKKDLINYILGYDG